MRMNVTRFPEIADGPDSAYLGELSMRFAQQFAQTMQAIGVCGMRVETGSTAVGRAPRLADLAMFDDVPSSVSRYAAGIASQAVPLLAALGIREIRMSPEQGDVFRLASLWEAMSHGSPQGPAPSEGEVQL